MTAAERCCLEGRAYRALLRKELAESRPALIVGLTTFLGLPLLWSGLYALGDPKHEGLPGMAVILWLLAGWLFSAVLGAQIVCRDFGRAQGAFLVGRPVTVAEVLRAKITIGFGLVLLLTLAVGLWEAAAAALAAPTYFDTAFCWIWLAAAVATLSSFWIGMAAAAITRQTLSGVMLAGLALVLLVTVPLISTWPVDAAGWLLTRAESLLNAGWAVLGLESARSLTWDESYRPEVIWRTCVLMAVAPTILVALILLRLLLAVVLPPAYRPRGWLGFVSLTTLLLAIAVYGLAEGRLWPLGVAVLLLIGGKALRFLTIRACRAERGLRMGTKSLAWTVALSLMAVFLMAMTQVGANVQVASTMWVGVADSPRPARTAMSGREVCVCSPYEAWHFHVSDTGDLVVAGHVSLFMDQDWRSKSRSDPVPVFDEAGQAFMVTCAWLMKYGSSEAAIAATQVAGDLNVAVQYGNSEQAIPAAEIHCELRRIAWESGGLGPALQIPAPPLATGAAGWQARDGAIDHDCLFVMYRVAPQPPERRFVPAPHAVLARYRLSGDNAPALLGSTDLGLGECAPLPRGWGYRFSRGLNGRLYVVDPTSPPYDAAPQDGGSADFGPCFFQVGGGWNLLYGQFVLDRGLTAYSDSESFLIVETMHGATAQTMAPAPELGGLSGLQGAPWQGPTARVIGRVRASPWAWLFRSSAPILVAGGPHQVWEVHDTSAICYDVSDPHHPRRIAHVTSYPIQNAVSGPDFLLLDHGAGFSIVKHPR